MVTHGLAIGLLGSSLIAYTLYLTWARLNEQLLTILQPLIY